MAGQHNRKDSNPVKIAKNEEYLVDESTLNAISRTGTFVTLFSAIASGALGAALASGQTWQWVLLAASLIPLAIFLTENKRHLEAAKKESEVPVHKMTTGLTEEN